MSEAEQVRYTPDEIRAIRDEAWLATEGGRTKGTYRTRSGEERLVEEALAAYEEALGIPRVDLISQRGLFANRSAMEWHFSRGHYGGSTLETTYRLAGMYGVASGHQTLAIAEQEAIDKAMGKKVLDSTNSVSLF